MPKTGNLFPAQLHTSTRPLKKSTISLIFPQAVYWQVYLDELNRFFIGYWTKIEAGFLSGLSLYRQATCAQKLGGNVINCGKNDEQLLRRLMKKSHSKNEGLSYLRQLKADRLKIPGSLLFK